MPFASEDQRRWMWANDPAMAHRWAHEAKAGPLGLAPVPLAFPNLAQGLVGISDRVLADHLALYNRAVEELGGLEAVRPRTSWVAPDMLAPAVVEEILRTPVRELRLEIGGRLGDLLARLRSELSARGIGWFPSFYLGEGDFWTADRAVSVNVPWYLANDALWEIVNAGDTRYDERDLMRVLRHEAAHAIGYAFGLWLLPSMTDAFGDFDEPYRDDYVPDPERAGDYVSNLGDSVSAPAVHYAQKHPDEDWAETFAVWLDPGSRWREDYADRPAALAKLDLVDRIVGAGVVGGIPPNRRPGRRVPYTDLGYTVGEFLGVNPGPDVAGLARRRIPEVLDSVILHEAYFEGLGRNGGAILPVGRRVAQFATNAWGSWDAFAHDHRQAARAATGGWVLTVWDPRPAGISAGRLRNVVVQGHGGGVPAGCPVILALDMHEHAWAGDRGNRAGDYVAAWWQNIDWVRADMRLDRAAPPPIPVVALAAEIEAELA